MSLFKVCPPDRSKKVMIKAATVEELINRAKIKLNIADGVYKVALDEDGTEVDDDEILSEIAKLSHKVTNLILLPEASSWSLQTENTAAASSEAGTSAATSIPRDHHEQNPSSYPSEVWGGNIWNKFPKRLIECCDNGQRAFDADRRSVVASIADYMSQDLKDHSRKTAERIAKMITDKYPKTFSDVINNEVIGSGIDSLRQQIYNAANYRKIHNETKRRAEMRLSDEIADNVLAPLKPRKHDEYGCTDYQPLLPPTESATSQTEKQLQLIQFFESHEKDDKKISELMDNTYPTQRVDINQNPRDIIRLFQVWAYLQRPKYFIDHASRLLGKSVQVVWEENLTMNAKAFRKYVIFTEKTKMIKLRKSKNSVREPNAPYCNETLNMISIAEASSIVSKSEMALTTVFFPAIAKQLKEDSQYFFRVIPENVESTEIIGYAEQDSPILIIRGKSLYDDKAKCDVVLDAKLVISARGVLDGFLITFLAYYVFGYEYLPEIQRTLEFVQRVLLQINPKTGGKRTDNKKRKSLSYDTAVMKLANAIEAFKED